MHFGPASLPHRHVREAWSRRLMVTLFVTAGTMMRWSDSGGRATLETDPYDDAF